MSEPQVARLFGIAASPGVVVGRAWVSDRRRVTVPRRHVETHEVDHEVGRLHHAISAARNQLQTLRTNLPEEVNDHGLILDAHLLMLDDQLLVDQAIRAIRSERVNAEWGLRKTVEKIKELFDQTNDEYFRERRSDVDFVGERIIRQLMGVLPEQIRTHGGGPVIVVAHEISPADMAAMVRSEVLGFVTDVGSSTSHTAIMARALSLPAVVGIAEATKHIATGDLLVIDGLRGEVFLRPTEQECEAAEDRGRRYTAFVRALGANHGQSCVTRCGTPIALRANIELPSEAQVARAHGADGIGLYRTEFLYIDRRTQPTEEEQYEVYRQIVETVAPRTVTLRTFDIGGDKFSSVFRMPKEMNPALGLRAVRLALREREVFRRQLRAMLRAANHGPVRIMVPMISALFELHETKLELAKAREELAERGIQVPDVPLGIMVETPSAVILSDLLARESAFFSIGTNDLIQYSLAIDRGNEHVAHLARPFDPAIIRSLATVARNARAHGIPCALCGALAANVMAVPALLGLGITELSVEPAAVPGVKAAIARVDMAEAREVMAQALDFGTAEEVEALLEERFYDRFADLLAAGEHGSFTETGTFVISARLSRPPVEGEGS